MVWTIGAYNGESDPLDTQRLSTMIYTFHEVPDTPQAFGVESPNHFDYMFFLVILLQFAQRY
jgi:hypothetical protein